MSARTPDAEYAQMVAQADALDPADQGPAAQVLRAQTMRARDWQRLNEARTQIRWAWHRFFQQFDVGRLEAGLLAEFADGGLLWVFAAIDPTLRHLPGVTRIVLAHAGTAAKPEKALLREDREADIGPIERWIAPALFGVGLVDHGLPPRDATPAEADAGAS